MTRDNISCLVCEKHIKHDYSPKFGNVIPGIIGATVWRAYGNWGTSLFDPINSNEFLEMYICDECLSKKSSIVYSVDVKVEKTETANVNTFDKYTEHFKANN